MNRGRQEEMKQKKADDIRKEEGVNDLSES